MKRIFRLLVLLLVIGSLAGITTSCAFFNDLSHRRKLETFKHKKPLPKKWIINDGKVAIIK